jgi:hypothetical protein
MVYLIVAIMITNCIFMGAIFLQLKKRLPRTRQELRDERERKDEKI